VTSFSRVGNASTRRSARGRGQVDAGLLASLLDEPYYVLAPPKSTGKELFNLSYVEAALVHAARARHLVATLSALTARLWRERSSAAA